MPPLSFSLQHHLKLSCIETKDNFSENVSLLTRVLTEKQTSLADSCLTTERLGADGSGFRTGSLRHRRRQIVPARERDVPARHRGRGVAPARHRGRCKPAFPVLQLTTLVCSLHISAHMSHCICTRKIKPDIWVNKWQISGMERYIKVFLLSSPALSYWGKYLFSTKSCLLTYSCFQVGRE